MSLLSKDDPIHSLSDYTTACERAKKQYTSLLPSNPQQAQVWLIQRLANLRSDANRRYAAELATLLSQPLAKLPSGTPETSYTELASTLALTSLLTDQPLLSSLPYETRMRVRNAIVNFAPGEDSAFLAANSLAQEYSLGDSALTLTVPVRHGWNLLLQATLSRLLDPARSANLTLASALFQLPGSEGFNLGYWTTLENPTGHDLLDLGNSLCLQQERLKSLDLGPANLRAINTTNQDWLYFNRSGMRAQREAKLVTAKRAEVEIQPFITALNHRDTAALKTFASASFPSRTNSLYDEILGKSFDHLEMDYIFYSLPFDHFVMRAHRTGPAGSSALFLTLIREEKTGQWQITSASAN
jgi:hypothetical protein